MAEIGSPPSYQQPVVRKKNTAVIIVVVVVAALIGGLFILQQSKKNKQPQVPAEKETPSPTEMPKIDKKDVKIEVLNGSGIAGQARIAADALKKAGFNPDNIKTDNAKDSDHKITTVAAKEGFDGVAQEAKDALAAVFDKVQTESSKLDKDNKFDIVVTTGGIPPTPTTGPSASPSAIPTGPTTTPTPSSATTPTPTSSTPAPTH